MLVVLVRRRPRSFRWTLYGAISLLLAFGVWLAVVAPVNAEVAAAAQATPQRLPELWTALRLRWEWGHVAGFVFQLAGVSALLASVLVDTPDVEP